MKRILLLLFIIVHQVVLSQNIGIGLSNPTKGKLEVVGVAGAGNTTAIFGSNVNGISLQQNWPTIGFNQYRDNTVGNGRFMSTGYAAIQYMDPGGGGMYIDMLGTGSANAITGSGSRAIAITKDGDVGIRNNGGGATLSVARGTANNTAIFAGTTYASYINNSTEENTFLRAGKANGIVYINDGVPNGRIIMGSNGGNTLVGINSGIPQYPLEITQVAISDIWEHGLLLRAPMHDNDTWEVHAAISLGFVYNDIVKASISSSNGQYFALSDSRFKTNIQPMTGTLERINQLKPVSYEMKNNNPQHEMSLGFIAQEVKPLFPELVEEKLMPLGNGEFGNRLMMNYAGFGVIAIKAIQEQQEEIENLKKRIVALEQLIKNNSTIR